MSLPYVYQRTETTGEIYFDFPIVHAGASGDLDIYIASHWMETQCLDWENNVASSLNGENKGAGYRTFVRDVGRKKDKAITIAKLSKADKCAY
jgi:hypothetical protein